MVHIENKRLLAWSADELRMKMEEPLDYDKYAKNRISILRHSVQTHLRAKSIEEKMGRPGRYIQVGEQDNSLTFNYQFQLGAALITTDRINDLRDIDLGDVAHFVLQEGVETALKK